MTDINRLITSLKRRSAHAKEFGHDVLFVKLEDLDALGEALEKAQESETQASEMAVQLSTRLTAAENRVRKQNRHICELFDDNTALRQRIAELESEVKFPGVMRCNVCGFSRTHVTATPDGMRAGKSEPENCPNGCGPMWHDTYRRQYDVLYDAYIALRESNTQIIKSRDHYKRMSEEGLKQLAESRTVTVKLPSERFRYGDSDYDDGFVNGWNARMSEDTAALDRVGIKWGAE